MKIRTWQEIIKTAKKNEEVYYENKFWNVSGKKGKFLLLVSGFEKIQLGVTAEGYAYHRELI